MISKFINIENLKVIIFNATIASRLKMIDKIIVLISDDDWTKSLLVFTPWWSILDIYIFCFVFCLFLLKLTFNHIKPHIIFKGYKRINKLNKIQKLSNILNYEINSCKMIKQKFCRNFK